ncbi:MAG: hypothetical protein AB7N76_07480 [Planctomycetota bacterium]
MHRAAFAVAALALVALPATGQEPPSPGVAPPERARSRLQIEVEAARVEVAPRGARQVVVYQADDRQDVRVHGARTVVREGKPETQRFDIRAEAVVAFLAGLEPGERPIGVPVTGIYARGFVRVEVDAPGKAGRHSIEAEELYLDFRREVATLRQGILRTGSGQGSGVLGARRVVVSADRLRAEGSQRVVAEGATVTVCDYTLPLWALAAERLEVEPSAPPPPLPASLGALGGLAGAASAGLRRGRTPLFSGLLGKQPVARPGAAEWVPVAGSDALLRARTPDYQLHAEGLHVRLLPPGLGLSEPLETPRIPWLGWDTAWPLPRLRVGQSSRFGTFATLGLEGEVTRLRYPGLGELRLGGEAGVDYYERRGTAGTLGVEWTHLDEGARQGEGFLRAFGLRDRADQDRVGAAIRNEGRFWMRGLLREKLPLGLQLDAEVSRVSDRGLLLEYFRSTAQTEKEQETYANLRGSWDDLGARLIGRARLNDFQTQLEQSPEARLDWVLHPLVTEPGLGGLYLDVALRGGHLRLRPDQALTDASYRAWRGDLQTTLAGKSSLGPFQLYGYGGVRETLWSEGAAEEGAVDRFAGLAGWNISTVLWRRFQTPWGVLRHEIVPEAGTRHVFGVSRARSALLPFDEIEELEPTDQVFLRARTRLLTDVDARRQKLLDLSVEGIYLMRDQGRDVGRSWLHLRYDLRLNLFTWLGLRARCEQDLNAGGLRDLSVGGTFRPTFAGPDLLSGSLRDLNLNVGYREVWDARVKVEAVSWGFTWRLTPAWAIALDQQYDFFSGEFLRHSGRLIRFFQGFALELRVSNDPQQDDTSVSFSIAPAFGAASDPWADQTATDRNAQLYPY